MVDQTSASWNQLLPWLRWVDIIRHDAAQSRRSVTDSSSRRRLAIERASKRLQRCQACYTCGSARPSPFKGARTMTITSRAPSPKCGGGRRLLWAGQHAEHRTSATAWRRGGHRCRRHRRCRIPRERARGRRLGDRRDDRAAHEIQEDRRHRRSAAATSCPIFRAQAMPCGSEGTG